MMERGFRFSSHNRYGVEEADGRQHTHLLRLKIIAFFSDYNKAIILVVGKHYCGSYVKKIICLTINFNKFLEVFGRFNLKQECMC